MMKLSAPLISAGLVALLHSAAWATPLVSATRDGTCYCLPGDDCWPSDATWNSLNSTVNGRLVATVPIGSPCHDPTYDAAACSALQQEWTNPLTHIPSSSSVMQTFFANQSCDPFTDRSIPCVLGNYVSYAVDVQDASDIQAALEFARENNIRVLVRNTGHDFLGRSTGAGALAIWTQSLKSIDFTEWSDSTYSGPAVTVGAGVLGYEILEASHQQGLTVVTGECATVGLAGGFTQGGGHSALSTAFGLGSDQTLAFQVITADGRSVTASPTENEDLYWAMSGGGAGTFGVVVSLTVRAYEAAPVGGAAFQLFAHTVQPDQFTAAVAKFHELLPGMLDDGAMLVYFYNAQMLSVNPMTVWNRTAAYVRDTVMAPFVEALRDEIGIDLPVAYSDLSYRDHYDRYLGPLPQGNLEVARYQFGGRLIPRSVLENSNDELQEALQGLAAGGVLAVGSAASYGNKPSDAPDNSVLPAWRDAAVQLQLITDWDPEAPWEEMVAAQERMTNEFMPLIESVTPGSGAYMNEADFRQPNWQETFFGENYARLRSIKRKWDPESVFYILKGVGSEVWSVAEDGRMCRAC